MKKLIAVSLLMSLTFYSFSFNSIITKIECKDLGLWGNIQHQNFLQIVGQNLFDNNISAFNTQGDNMMTVIENKADTIYKSGQMFGIKYDYEKLKKQEFDRVFNFYMYDSIVIKNDSLEFNEYYYEEAYLLNYGIDRQVSPQIRISLSEVLGLVDEDVKLYLDIFKKNNLYSRKEIPSAAINIIDEFNNKIRKLMLSSNHKVYFNDSFTHYFQNDSSLYSSYYNKFTNGKKLLSLNLDSALHIAKFFDSASNDLPLIFLVIDSESFDIIGVSTSVSYFFSGTAYIGKFPFGYLKSIDIQKDQSFDWEFYSVLSRKALATKLMADYDNLIKHYNSDMGID